MKTNKDVTFFKDDATEFPLYPTEFMNQLFEKLDSKINVEKKDRISYITPNDASIRVEKKPLFSNFWQYNLVFNETIIASTYNNPLRSVVHYGDLMEVLEPEKDEVEFDFKLKFRTLRSAEEISVSERIVGIISSVLTHEVLIELADLIKKAPPPAENMDLNIRIIANTVVDLQKKSGFEQLKFAAKAVPEVKNRLMIIQALCRYYGHELTDIPKIDHIYERLNQMFPELSSDKSLKGP